MPATRTDEHTNSWTPKSIGYYSIEVAVIVLIALSVVFLRFGQIDQTTLQESHFMLTTPGAILLWFLNRFILGRILQARLDQNNITQRLPLELLITSVLITSLVYFAVYSIIIFQKDLTFDPSSFSRGFLLSVGLSSLIFVIYTGGQMWNSWWSDGNFLFETRSTGKTKTESLDSITIKNSRGTFSLSLHEVLYFISESKVTFLVDSSGKKWITQYNLSELESILDKQFFRLNRKILVSRQVVSEIRKLPNHRLLVTIGPSDESHHETISRYKSTRFKEWYQKAS